jgi:TetR/AcrR family transcriptional repressor of nem operon
MGRPKQFDPEEAMQEAMEAFWERGYAATSVNDLLEEMGLNRGSLYGTFGDKKQLFLAALEKYDEQRVQDLHRLLDQPGPATNSLRALLQFVADDCIAPTGKRGCLAAKAAMELAPHDKDVAAWLKKLHRRNVRLIAAVVQRGQEAGEISRKVNPDAVARFVLNNMAGMRLLGTTSPSPSELREVVDLIMKVLE